jgi:hypothetical protein
MNPRHDVYDDLPDWARGVCLEHVPTATWLDGGLEAAAVEIDRLIRVRGEEPARLGLLRMARDGSLDGWLAKRLAAAQVAA